MMRTVYLHGSMAEEYGPSFRLCVASLAEAVRALGAQLPGFRRAIEEGRFRVAHKRGDQLVKHLHEGLIDFGLGEGDLHVVPVVKGAKSKTAGGVGKVILGVLIAAVAFWAGAPSIAFMGLGLAVAGVSSLLTNTKRKQERKSDFIETGDVAQQGDCVSLAYGRCMITAKTVSAGVTTTDSNGYGIAVGTGQYVSQVGNSTARK